MHLKFKRNSILEAHSYYLELVKTEVKGYVCMPYLIVTKCLKDRQKNY